jgi:alkaline phosphatase
LTGGAEYFKAPKSLKGNDYYKDFQKAGYHLVFDKKQLLNNKKKDEKLMGIFRKGNLDV